MLVQNDYFKKLLKIGSGVSNFEHEDIVIPMLSMFDKLILDTILPYKITYKTSAILTDDEIETIKDFFDLAQSRIRISAFQTVFLETDKWQPKGILKINILNDGETKPTLFKYNYKGEILILKTCFDEQN